MTALKEAAAKKALDYILPNLESDTVLGIGTGSTSEIFIDLLKEHKHRSSFKL